MTIIYRELCNTELKKKLDKSTMYMNDKRIHKVSIKSNQ
jgi:hypothetical protein